MSVLSTRDLFEAILRDRDMLHDGQVMTDAVLLVAIEDFGSSTTYARVYPDNGQQPVHRTKGLLVESLDELRDLESGGRD